ncbi:MAG: fatty acid cis/trans isomerase [Myxococcota bacterium]
MSIPFRLDRATLVAVAMLSAASLLLIACRRDDASSPEDAAEAVVARTVVAEEHDARWVLDHRCVVCHACYDAPCQLQLGSAEGVNRGASPDAVYDAKRLTPQRTTRLHVDAHDEPGWRALGFHDVVHGPAGTADGVMGRMLALGRSAHLAPGERLPEDFPLALDRKLACPVADRFEAYVDEHPLGGMPYGLTPLAEGEYADLVAWLGEGAPSVAPRAPLDPAVAREVETWERFLNGDSLRERITARYLYEHWFVTHLYFEAHASGPFFRLVRSSTPPGQPTREIATRRPYDDPGEARFWYRLVRIDDTLVHKTHIVYPLGPERLERLRALFLEPEWSAKDFPPYGHAKASNPFETFDAIPARSRYQFLLDDARHFVATFIRGPVCHGQVAVDVIEDRFWVAFLDPDWDLSVNDPRYLERTKALLDLPAEDGSLAIPGEGLWAKHTANQRRYLDVREELYEAFDARRRGPPLEAIWDGDGHDRDALLTVWRHFDNASVERGLIGTPPETAWVMDYPIFERIYYDLVAGFDVFGNLGHQVATRLYMDHLRMQSENVLLAFLPESARQPLRDAWYEGATDEIHHFVNRPISEGHGTRVRFETDRYVEELFAQVRARSPEAAGPDDLLNRCDGSDCLRPGTDALAEQADAGLRPLAGRRGDWVRHLPEVSWLRVHADDDPERGHVYTLTHDVAHTNVASMFGEKDRLQPELDEVTLFAGTLGSYPNFFFDVAAEELGAFREQLLGVHDAAAMRALVARFGIRRTDPRFWPLLDWIHADVRQRMPTEGAIYDLGRYKNL